MERLDEVLARVLANCRVRMDERRKKTGGAVEAPPEVPRGEGRMAKSHAGKSGRHRSTPAMTERTKAVESAQAISADA
jgi:hypothetical protein